MKDTEETNNRGKIKPSYPHYKQRHFTAEGAEIAEKGMFLVYKQYP